MTAVVLLSVFACARPVGKSGLRELRDGLGRTVRVPAPEKIRRIVSLAPSSTEILFAVGAGPRVVGVDTYSDWPPAARALPKIGAEVDPSLERVVGLRPDIVFTATSANTQATVAALERLALPVFVSRAERLDEIYRDIEAIGDVVGRQAAARQVIAGMRRRIAALSPLAHAAPALVAVWTTPLKVAGRASHVSDLVRAAGGVNVADDSPDPFPTYSLERLIALAPEVVVVGTHGPSQPPLAPLADLASQMGSRRFRVEAIDGDLLFRPGPRVAEGVEALGRLLRSGGKP